MLASLLPSRRFRRALDLGCGLGLLSRHLAACADTVVGVDVAPSAVARARALHADQPNILFEAHDLLNLPASFDGSFDLVVVADVLYYLSPLDDALLKAIALRIAALLAPAGMCMLVNHYFSWLDPESRRSYRIHEAFRWSPGFTLQAEYRRPFYLVSCCVAEGTERRFIEEASFRQRSQPQSSIHRDTHRHPDCRSRHLMSCGIESRTRRFLSLSSQRNQLQ